MISFQYLWYNLARTSLDFSRFVGDDGSEKQELCRTIVCNHVRIFVVLGFAAAASNQSLAFSKSAFTPHPF
jgi:hypothetical protein